MTVAGKSGQARALEVLIPAMKHVTERPFADPEVAARQLVQLASGIKAVQDGRIHIEKINYPFPTRSGKRRGVRRRHQVRCREGVARAA
jgi:hypothetical protein